MKRLARPQERQISISSVAKSRQEPLPRETLEEAARRRNERIVVEELALQPATEILPPPAEALSDYCLDLRRV